jgi:hypothetical protein
MEYLSQLVVENFKGFGERTEVPLGPITLIFGANSGGKSSLLQSLLLMKQTEASMRSSGKRTPLLVRGDQTDLGSFRGLINRHQLERQLTLGLTLSRTGEADFAAEVTVSQPTVESPIQVDRMKTYGEAPSFELIPLPLDHPARARSGSRHGSARGGAFGPTSPLLYGDVNEYLAWHSEISGFSDASQPAEVRDSASHRIEPVFAAFERRGMFNLSIQGLFDANGDRLTAEGDPLEEFLGEATYGQTRRAMAESFDDLVGPGRVVGGRVLRLSYLGPLRAMPERLTVLTGEPSDDLGTAGENIVALMSRDENQVRRINNWLQRLEIPYEVRVRQVLDPHVADTIGEVHSLMLLDRRSGVEVSATDVGFGISQILPLIFEAAANRRSGTLLIEQPEIHLHPALQTRLADLFVEMLDRDRQVILETHSEHMILRLQRLVRRGRLSPDDVCVLHVSVDSDGQNVVRLRLNSRGEFIDEWPGGFFDERLEEIFGD